MKLPRTAEQEARRSQLRRWDLMERGLCYQCGKRPPEELRTRCADCIEQSRVYRREAIARYRRLGICCDCGSRPALLRADGKPASHCGRCRERRRQRRLARELGAAS